MVPPTAGQPQTQTVTIDYCWCDKCKCWTSGDSKHKTETHKTKEELAAANGGGGASALVQEVPVSNPVQTRVRLSLIGGMFPCSAELEEPKEVPALSVIIETVLEDDDDETVDSVDEDFDGQPVRALWTRTWTPAPGWWRTSQLRMMMWICGRERQRERRGDDGKE